MTDAELKPFGFFDKAHWIAQVEKMKPGRKFKPGNLIKGPEFPGCFNTGTRATIRRAADGKFMVGRELDVMEITDRRLFGGKKSQRTWKMDHGRVVTVLKGRKQAVERFAELCESDSRIHAEERAKIKLAQQQLKSKDPTTAIAAAMTLADSGMV